MRTVMVYRQSTADHFAQRGEVLYRQEGLIEQVYVPPVEPLYAELQHFRIFSINWGRARLAPVE